MERSECEQQLPEREYKPRGSAGWEQTSVAMRRTSRDLRIGM